ncbi:MAG: hypothetical protein EPN56_01535 [Rhodanobacter sp.]|nr:MAG: hypothetical protein EPN78_03340 [Rhodanobacter sp.]TAM14499.1 MAG: hypothetical protein EPN66_01300 [Rhodanobacter sp.]TAM37291.1 MAG: hypothetical protein EPN56_01535 [Rhodanobacter sp.]
MHLTRIVLIVAANLIAGAALAQSAPTAPLNTKLPPQTDLPPTSLPASASTAPAPASAPGVYYGDTSGAISRPRDTELADARRCDDSTYDKPQVHGSVGMGAMGGSHMSGNYQTGTMSVGKNLGSCDDPKGSVNFSIGVGQGNFHGRRW